jgi:hypothetical protein
VSPTPEFCCRASVDEKGKYRHLENSRVGPFQDIVQLHSFGKPEQNHNTFISDSLIMFGSQNYTC